MFYRVGNPYSTNQSLAPAKPTPTAYVPRKPARDPKAAAEARARLAARMHRAHNPQDYD